MDVLECFGELRVVDIGVEAADHSSDVGVPGPGGEVEAPEDVV